MLSLCEKMQGMIQFTQGCTEPAAIALNAAYVGIYLKDAQKIELNIDKMTFKNAYRAGIPNSEDNIGVTFSLLFGNLLAKINLPKDYNYKYDLLGKTFYDTIKNIKKYKKAFSMFDMRTIEILRSKDASR